MEYAALEAKILSYEKLYIYGAGIVAYGVYVAISELMGRIPEAFLVSDVKGNPSEMAQIPVRSLKEAEGELENSFILIATPEEYHEAIAEVLEQWELQYERLTSHLEYVLMGEYLSGKGFKRVQDIEKASKEVFPAGICVYMASSVYDKALKAEYKEPYWGKKLQVGAALTDERIAEITDDLGDNISERNPLYGELTASYWLWKHAKHDIIGLFHYRRVLELDESVFEALVDGSVDVILPLPFVCYPDTSGQYGRYLNKEDQAILWKVLEEFEPDRWEQIKEILKGQYLYNYNILVARKNVFDEYCEWMFPILEEIEKRCEAEEKDRLPRYIGRVGEVLTSVYFMMNKDKFRIVHAEKVWRV